jgi:hypothetical protein
MVLKTDNIIIDIDAIDVAVKQGDRVSIGVKGLGIELSEEDAEAVWDMIIWTKQDFMVDKDRKKLSGRTFIEKDTPDAFKDKGGK